MVTPGFCRSIPRNPGGHAQHTRIHISPCARPIIYIYILPDRATNRAGMLFFFFPEEMLKSKMPWRSRARDRKRKSNIEAILEVAGREYIVSLSRVTFCPSSSSRTPYTVLSSSRKVIFLWASGISTAIAI